MSRYSESILETPFRPASFYDDKVHFNISRET